VTAIRPIVLAFEALGVRYYIGGSVASSTHGVSRSTIDADIVADLKQDHVDRFCDMLGNDYYVEADTIREAIGRRDSFSVIFTPSMYKVDIFMVGNLFERCIMERSKPYQINANDTESRFIMATAEDIVLHKPVWFRTGGEVSERQWLDVLNVLKVQAGQLDEAYLDEWADALDVTRLLHKAHRRRNCDGPDHQGVAWTI
jgi:hypothetical protein